MNGRLEGSKTTRLREKIESIQLRVSEEDVQIHSSPLGSQQGIKIDD